MHIQDPQPIQELAKDADLNATREKVNEIVRLLNAMWFTDEIQHTND